MNKIMICAAAVAALSLGACDRFGGRQEQKPAQAKQEKPKAAPKKNINQPVEDAMMRIPPEMRADYSKAFGCEVKRNQAKGEKKAIEVTPQYVDGLVARLKAEPSLAKC